MTTASLPNPVDTHVRCAATKTDGTPCTKFPIKGGTVCWKHGGGAPQVKRRAQQRIAEQKLTQRAQWIVAARPIIDPLAAFQEAVAEVVAFKDLVSERVAELSEWRYEDAKGAEQLRSELAMLERSYDRVTKVLADWIRLGLDERMVKVQEQQVALIRTALERVFDDAELEITDVQRERWPAVVARHMRLLEAG